MNIRIVGIIEKSSQQTDLHSTLCIFKLLQLGLFTSKIEDASHVDTYLVMSN